MTDLCDSFYDIGCNVPQVTVVIRIRDAEVFVPFVSTFRENFAEYL